ncbi:MAG TPA: sigma factor, partial [Actinomycetota bacterium]|nr:sigma factor [Actinomycetota bacterium]
MTDPPGPLTPEAEQELMRRLISGDEDAARALYGRFGRPVYGLGLRMLGSAGAAEELTQDVFVRAWEKLASFRGESSFSTWLHRLTINV